MVRLVCALLTALALALAAGCASTPSDGTLGIPVPPPVEYAE